MHRHAIIALLVVVAAPVAAASLSAADSRPMTIDADHPLTDETAITTYKEDGVVSGQLGRIDARITIADDHEDAGVPGLHRDIDRVWLRIQYNETIPRTIRLYIPDAYWTPRAHEAHASESGDATATYKIHPSGNYTVVTLELDGRTDAAWAATWARGAWFSKGGLKDAVENKTGWRLPIFGASSTWQHASPSDLDSNTTYRIKRRGEPVTVQYNLAGDPRDPRWVAAPACGDESTPVCRYDPPGDDQYVYVLVKTEDRPPAVRYRHGNSFVSNIRSGINDALNADDRLNDIVDSITSIFDNSDTPSKEVENGS